MSRTKRSPYFQLHQFRHPKTLSIKKVESKAMDALRDEGYIIPCRLKARGNPRSPVIPDSYDDVYCTAWRQRGPVDNIMEEALCYLLNQLGINRKQVQRLYKKNSSYGYTVFSNYSLSKYSRKSAYGYILCSITGEFIKGTLRPELTIKWLDGSITIFSYPLWLYQ